MNIYYNNAEDPYEKKLVEMKEIKNGNIYPGWMRLTYKDKMEIKKDILVNMIQSNQF